MIEPSTVGFVTLLLGLTSGSWPVEVMVAPPAVAVEVRLDGAAVAKLTAPPWQARVDFGPDLVPHELTAVALDAEGRTIGQATQWVNMPQPEAHLDVVLERDSQDRVTAARLGWASKQGMEPIEIEAELDGTPLAASAADRVWLPNVDMSRAHVLRVSVWFEGGGAATRELVFGGSVGTEASAELTAVLALARKADQDVSVDQLQGHVLVGGKPARVVAVEKGSVTIGAVIEQEAFAALEAAGAQWASGESRRSAYSFHGKDRLLVVDPRPVAAQGPAQSTAALFPTREFRGFSRLSLPGCLGSIAPNGESTAPQHLANAVGVAGVLAAGGQGRRAVVLVLMSEVVPAELKRSCTLLSALGVPLHVWYMGGTPRATTAGDCGVWWNCSGTRGRASSGFRRANSALGKVLDRQLLVWIEGTHRPQDVTLAPGSPLVGLVR